MRARLTLVVVGALTMARAGVAAASPGAEPPPSQPPPTTAAPATVPSPATPPPASSGAKFGVLGIGPAGLSPGLAAALEAAAATGLAASGGEVVARALTTRPAGSCDTPACLQGVSRASGVRYLLRGTCELEASTYRVHLELVDSVTGTVAVARQDTCEICTEHDVVEATNIAASALKAALDRAAPPAATGHAIPGADLSAGEPGKEIGSAPRPLWLRVAPWVAFAAAAGAIGAGAYIVSLNGKETGVDVPEAGMKKSLYDTGWEGGALIGGGVVAAALGVLALTWTPSHGAAAASPTGGSAAPAVAGAPARPPAGLSFSRSGLSAWTTF